MSALDFDWVNPDYHAIWVKRAERLARLRADPVLLEAARRHYRDARGGIADFINDWGVTVDPRNAGTGRPVIMPFVLFPKQRDFVEFVIAQWRGQDDGILVKSRDCGASWLAMGTSVALCLFWRNITIGFGSAKEEKVDRSGDPDCLFYKGRTFVQYLPREFKGLWDIRKNSAHMRMSFPDSDSSITGEAGDNIGRGGRKAIYFVDEFAFIERPKLIDASLVANTNCRVEMSSVQGTANVFAERARGGKIKRFDFHYRDDPRKVDPVTKQLRPDFEEKKAKTDPVVWEAEYECNFLASVEGIIIPQDWVQSAIGSFELMGIPTTGVRRGAFDVADMGKDKNCFGSRHGNVLAFIKSWSGKASDIMQSVVDTFAYCDQLGLDEFIYDQDGMGAGVRGDARVINEARAEKAKDNPAFKPLRAIPFRGSGAVVDPERKATGTDRKNEDFFENFKAQCWWSLRWRFLRTHRAVLAFKAGKSIPFNPSELISLSPDLPELTKTCAELSQPVWKWSKSGKMMIDKTPDDVASPNNGDTVMMLFSPVRGPMVISDNLLSQA